MYKKYSKIHKNISQFITPSVSFQIEKSKNTIEINTRIFGYRIIELREDHIFSQVRQFSDAN